MAAPPHVDYARPTPATRTAPRVVRYAALAILAAILGWFTYQGIYQLRDVSRAQDFEYFYKAGWWLLHDGVSDPGYDIIAGQPTPRGQLDWYWPAVARLMTLPAMFPFRTAGTLWALGNLAAAIAICRMLGRHFNGLPHADWPVTILVPFLTVVVYWRWEMRLNQIDILTLLLLMGSFVCWQRQKRTAAGLWVGLAVLIKITPGLFLIWYALKREFRIVAVALLTLVLFGPIADAVVLGPPPAYDAYRGWLDRAVTQGGHAGLITHQREMDWRNQALGAVTCRWLRATPYNTNFDNDPRMAARFNDTEQHTLNVLNLPRGTVATTVTAVALITLALLLAFWRRNAARLNFWQLRLEFALVLLAMLWLMPVMRLYHMIWTLPAIVVLGGCMHHLGRRDWATWLLGTIIALVAAAQLAVLSQAVQARGPMLAAVLLLICATVIAHTRIRDRADPVGAPTHA
jgi:hypothetical protein